MRPRLRVLALILACGLAGGCFVVEEIDQGMEIMEQHSDVEKKKAAEDKKAAEEAARKEQEGPGLLDRLRAWWSGGDEDDGSPKVVEDDGPPPEPGNVVGRCEIGGSTQFMRKFDCQLRGGTYTALPGSASR